MLANSIQRVYTNNEDIDNHSPSVKQYCSDVVHIILFFDGTGNNKESKNTK